MRPPDAIADVSMIPTELGGRDAATPSGWFGCPMILPGLNLDVRLRLAKPLSPGESRRVDLFFLDPDLAAARLQPGTRFHLWELRIIGSGVIREMHADASAVSLQADAV